MESCLLESDGFPVFTIKEDQLRILDSPEEFYLTLLDLIRRARHRIVLSTLYIGTGSLETQLVDAIQEAAQRDVKVLILLDAHRGCRRNLLTQSHSDESPHNPRSSIADFKQHVTSSCELLAPLTSFPNVSVALYRNPHTRGLFCSTLPTRLTEVLGVQHIKAYVIDDSVILSGANLSHEYFTNRQDRAWLFERTHQLANFYVGMVRVISKFCYHLSLDGVLRAISADADPVKAHLLTFKRNFRSALTSYLDSTIQSNPKPSRLTEDVYLFPLVQFGPYEVRVEEHFTERLFRSVSDDRCSHNIALASGYFNLTRAYENLLFNYVRHHPCPQLEFLCASPEANGFLRSKGLSGYIPMAYRESQLKLMSRFSLFDDFRRPRIFEYNRSGWTFHAKGLWIEEKSFETTKRSAVMTFIGSSNFSYRSLNRDLESQLVVWTRDEKLKERILAEKRSLFSRNCHCATLLGLFSMSHFRLPWYLRFLYPILHTFM